MLQNRPTEPRPAKKTLDPARPSRRHGPPVGRRKVLQALALAPLAAIATGCSKADGRPPRGKVLIVGGGLCGLRALDLLVAAGFDATLLEGGGRTGGRIRTFSDGLPAGVWAEAGAERIRVAHTRVQALLRELGEKAMPYGDPTEPYMLDVGGESHRFRDTSGIPRRYASKLTEVERGGFPGRVHLAMAREHPAPSAADPRTAWQWLKDVGMSDEGARWIRAWAPWPLDRLPAATFHRYCLDEGEKPVTVDGGVERLPRALAARHEKRIVRDAVIRGIDVKADAVTVETTTGATHTAPHVITCLPIEPTRKLTITGVDTTALDARVAAIRAEHEIKLHLLVPGIAFGEDRASSIMLRTDFPRATWPSPRYAKDGTRAINMMAVHEDVPELQKHLARGKRAVIQWLLGRIPHLAVPSRDVLWHDYASDPLAGGAWAWAPGDGGRPAGAPEQLGRLIVAGGDLSTLPGWMEGALQSAEDAVKLVTG